MATEGPEIGDNIELVTYDSVADAKAADASTFAFLVARDGAHGSRWSDIFESENGQEFAVVHSPDTDGHLSSTPFKQKKVKKPTWKKYVEEAA